MKGNFQVRFLEGGELATGNSSPPLDLVTANYSSRARHTAERRRVASVASHIAPSAYFACFAVCRYSALPVMTITGNT